MSFMRICRQLHQLKSLRCISCQADCVQQVLPLSQKILLQLIPDLSGGVDPDDSFSKVPYERGFYFLTYLQNVSPFLLDMLLCRCSAILLCKALNLRGRNPKESSRICFILLGKEGTCNCCTANSDSLW